MINVKHWLVRRGNSTNVLPIRSALWRRGKHLTLPGHPSVSLHLSWLDQPPTPVHISGGHKQILLVLRTCPRTRRAVIVGRDYHVPPNRLFAAVWPAWGSEPNTEAVNCIEGACPPFFLVACSPYIG